MAITKSAVSVFASAAVPAGGTKAAPATGGTGASVSTATYGRSGLTWRIKNGTAPGAAGVMCIQISTDGSNWFDYQTVAGDTVLNSEYSGTIIIDAYVQNVRALCYGHITNPVTFEAILQAVAG